MKEDLNILDEVNKGALMALSSIKYIYDMSDDKKFKNELKNEYKEYEKIHKKANNMYLKYSNEDAMKVGIVGKTMLYSGMKMKTIMDSSVSKLASLMLKGVNMGIIEGRKLLNNKNSNKEVHKLLEEFVTMQEENVEILKTYL